MFFFSPSFFKEKLSHRNSLLTHTPTRQSRRTIITQSQNLEKLTWGKTIPKKRAGRRRKKEGFVDTQDGYDPMVH